jgi:citrate lyase subunit beta/citryl-CoA lyase/(S)-citramalyl-CoA lyase
VRYTRYCRTVLWTSAATPERFGRAHASGADICVVDLEDSVSRAAKPAARRQAADFFSAPPAAGTRRGIRINALTEPDGLGDLLAIPEYPVAPDVVVVPKAETARDIEIVDALLAPRCPDVELFAIVETPRGLANATAIGTASRRVRALLFGAADYSFAVGADRSWEAMAYARSALVNSARAAGVEVVDSPMFEISDLDDLRAECERARRFGFSGKAGIHPRHIPVIREAFTPDDETLAAARRVASSADGDVTVVDGAMVGRPFFDASRRLLSEFDPQHTSDPRHTRSEA